MRLYKLNNNGSVGYWDISVTDNAELRIAHARSETAKEVVRLIPCKGKNIGRANETTDMEQAEKEMVSRIKKQKDKGYRESIEEAKEGVTNSLGMIKPTLAVVFSKVKPERIDWSTSYIQPKLDGNRCLYKDGILYSRGGKEINLPHIVAAIKEVGWEGYHLDGELYVDHNTSLQELGSLVRRPREESEAIVYHVFDVVSEKSFEDRFLNGLEDPSHPSLEKVFTTEANDLSGVSFFSKAFIEDGYEGAILRHGTQGYEADKRSQNLLKIKEYLDAESVVVGVVEGTPYSSVHGEYKVPVWVIKNPFGGDDFRATAEGTIERKHQQWLDREKHIGKEIKFKYFMLSEDNIPLQPVVLGWV